METQTLLALSEKYGSPLYVYDADKIISQYNRLTDAFSTVDNLKLNYAVKANSNISVLKVFKKLDSGIDCVSYQEVQLGLQAGFEPSDIIFTPNGISLKEIEMLLNLDVKSILTIFQFWNNLDITIRKSQYVYESIHILWPVETEKSQLDI